MDFLTSYTLYDTGSHPLHNAAEREDIAAIEAHLATGVDVDVRNRFEETPLMIAAQKGKLGVMRKLIEEGADVKAKDKNNKTTVHQVIHSILILSQIQASIIDFLLKKGAELEKDLFYFYAKNGDVAGIEVCLKVFQVDMRNERGETPLMIAASSGQLRVMHRLLKAKANVKTKDKNNRTILCNVIEISSIASEIKQSVIRLLLENGAELEGALLHYYAQIGNLEGIKRCLSAKIDVDFRDSLHGETALMMAARHKHFKAMKILIKSGANKHALTFFSSTGVLDQALGNSFLKKDKEEILKIFLRYGIYSMSELEDERGFRELDEECQGRIKRYADSLMSAIGDFATPDVDSKDILFFLTWMTCFKITHHCLEKGVLPGNTKRTLLPKSEQWYSRMFSSWMAYFQIKCHWVVKGILPLKTEITAEKWYSRILRSIEFYRDQMDTLRNLQYWQDGQIKKAQLPDEIVLKIVKLKLQEEAIEAIKQYNIPHSAADEIASYFLYHLDKKWTPLMRIKPESEELALSNTLRPH